MSEKVIVLADDRKQQDFSGLFCMTEFQLYPVTTLQELQFVLQKECQIAVAVTPDLILQYGEYLVNLLKANTAAGVSLMVLYDSEDDLPEILDDDILSMDMHQKAGNVFGRIKRYVAAKRDCKKSSSVIAVGLHPESLDSVTENFGELNAFIGISSARNKLLSIALKYAACNTRILLTGESGTGKTYLAELIHKAYTLEQKKKAAREGRKAETGFFTKCNVASLGSYLVESEIFGHEKGAFTGADRRKDGYIAECHNGTLFFDEVTDIPLEQQVKFLDFVQTGNYCRVGSSEVQHSEARIISATHDDIQLALHQGKIREDLLYRLAVKIIHIPSLNERREDIPSIADFILGKFNTARKMQRWFTESAYEGLMEHDWTGGNIRSLEGYIERMFVESSADALTYDDVRNAEQLFA